MPGAHRCQLELLSCTCIAFLCKCCMMLVVPCADTHVGLPPVAALSPPHTHMHAHHHLQEVAAPPECYGFTVWRVPLRDTEAQDIRRHFEAVGGTDT